MYVIYDEESPVNYCHLINVLITSTCIVAPNHLPNNKTSLPSHFIGKVKPNTRVLLNVLQP